MSPRGVRKAVPWIARPDGEAPEGRSEQARVLLRALRDLPGAAVEDDVPELAAGMSFWLLFSIFPALVCVVSLLPYLPIDAPIQLLFDVTQPLLPREVHDVLTTHISDLVSRPRTGLLTISLALALFSSSRAMVTLSRTLNRTFRVTLRRSEFIRRIRSIALTLGLMLGVVTIVMALSLGDDLVRILVGYDLLPVGSGIAIVIVRWPLLLVLGAMLVEQLYLLLPDERRRPRALSWGSGLAVLTWVLGTWVFTTFAVGFFRFNVTYGSLGSAAVVMAWMYLGAYALMIGATFNALVERGLLPSAGEERRKAERRADESGPEAAEDPAPPPLPDEDAETVQFPAVDPKESDS